MNLPRHTRHHPLQFLIYLEWILLFFVAIGERSSFLIYQLPRVMWVNWTGWGLIMLTSLWVPQRQIHRIVYTIAIAALIVLMLFVGGVRLFPVLCMVLVIRSCFIFKPRICIGITAVALALCVWGQIYRFQFLTLAPEITQPDSLKRIWLSGIFLAGLTFVFLQLLMFTVLSERQSREQLMIAHGKLRHYALEIENLATVQERNRIAREIHDSLGHSLTIFNLHLTAALRLWETDPTEAKALLTEAQQLSTTALQAVRQSVATLRSDPLQGQSLSSAIATLIKDFERSTAIAPQFHYAVDHPLNLSLRIATYRIVQEALTNICKYAAATQVTVNIRCGRSRRVEVLVQDNGQGFNATQTTTGFGLQGMQERTLALGGEFTLTTAPQAGCCIEASLPLDPAFFPHADDSLAAR